MSQAQLDHLVKLQIKINDSIMPDWRDQGLLFERPLWVECGELMNHLGGWKWWKREDSNWPQAKLELVDILHFGISLNLVSCEHPRWSEEAGTPIHTPLVNDGILHLELLMLAALRDSFFSVPRFQQVISNFGISFHEIYKLFIGKNVLNHFRQENGYNINTYNKKWDFGNVLLEDNEVLDSILSEDVGEDAGLEQRVHSKLTEAYSKALKINKEIEESLLATRPYFLMKGITP